MTVEAETRRNRERREAAGPVDQVRFLSGLKLEVPAVPTATELLLDKRDSDLYLRFQLSRQFGSKPFLPNPSI